MGAWNTLPELVKRDRHESNISGLHIRVWIYRGWTDMGHVLAEVISWTWHCVQRRQCEPFDLLLVVMFCGLWDYGCCKFNSFPIVPEFRSILTRNLLWVTCNIVLSNIIVGAILKTCLTSLRLALFNLWPISWLRAILERAIARFKEGFPWFLLIAQI